MKILTILGSTVLVVTAVTSQAQGQSPVMLAPNPATPPTRLFPRSLSHAVTTPTTTSTGATSTQTMLTTSSTGQPIVPLADYGGDYGSGYHASTAAEGFFRGLGDMARSEGQFNYNTSKAAINATEATRRAIENQRRWVESYFDLRRMNAERRALERGSRPTMADLARYAQAGMPRRLNPSELDPFTGQVAWPILLRSADFAHDREPIEKILADRAALGTISTADFLRANRIAADMLATLKQQIHDVPTGAYMTARRFLEALGYELAQPTTRLAAQVSAPALALTP